MVKTILFQGDSITDCGRVRDNARSVSQALGQGYPTLIAARVKNNDWSKKYNFINRGISGDRVVDLYARWKRDALNLRPDVISILIGVNDTWHEQNYGNGVEPERYDRFYRMLMDWTKEALPGTRMILLEPFVLKFGFVTDAWVSEIDIRRQMVKKIAEDYGAVFVPLQEIISEKAAEAADPEIVLADGVHPTLFGHQIIADQYLKYAGDLLK